MRSILRFLSRQLKSVLQLVFSRALIEQVTAHRSNVVPVESHQLFGLVPDETRVLREKIGAQNDGVEGNDDPKRNVLLLQDDVGTEDGSEGQYNSDRGNVVGSSEGKHDWQQNSHE